jgi:hypothetical protein
MTFRGDKAMSSVKILSTGIVSIVIQFGLAIAGWGGSSAFFAHPALQALAWVTVKEDRSNRWVLGTFTLIALLVAYFSAYTDRTGFWTLDAMRWTGVGLSLLDRDTGQWRGSYSGGRQPRFRGSVA